MAAASYCRKRCCCRAKAETLYQEGPPPLEIHLKNSNFAKMQYGIVGGPPANFFSSMFALLLGKSYFYLLGFIFQVIGMIVLAFLVPFAIIVLGQPGIAVTGAHDVLDAFAVAFSGFFAVNSGYLCNSPGSVILLTLETAVGKLSLAGLTALLVIKVSRVPNHMVVSSRLLIHKRKGKWTLSFRIGALHYQKIHGLTVRLYHYGTISDQWSITNLQLGGMVQVDNITLAGPEPWNIRHVIDEDSPLKDLDMEDRQSVEKSIEMFDVHIQGFDTTTGRNCGLHQVFQWEKGSIIYAPEGELTDAFIKMTPEQKNMSKANATKTSPAHTGPTV